MHRNRTWQLYPTELRTQRNRILPIEGGDSSTQRIDFTQLNSTSLASIGTFTRAGSANYIGSDGFSIVSATTDQPRFEYDSNGNPLGLLLEGTGINYCKWSEDQSNAAWNQFNNGVKGGKSTVVTMPDGTKNGNIINITGAVASGMYQTFATMGITMATDMVVTCSVWACVESGTGTARISYFNATTGVSTYGTTFDLTTTPRRISATFRLLNTNTASNITIENGVTLSTQSIVWWGYQVEVATNYTSYMASNASNGTRVADSFAITTGLTGTNGWFNHNEGTILVTGDQVNTTGGGYPRFVVFSPTSTSSTPLITIGTEQASGKFFGNYKTGTEANGNIGDDVYSVRTSTQQSLFSFAYGYAQSSGYAASLNGETATTTAATGTFATTGINRVTFSRDTGNVSWHLKGFIYWPTRKSNSEIKQIAYDSIVGPLPSAAVPPIGSINHIDDNNVYVIWSNADGSGTTTPSSGKGFVLPSTGNYDFQYDVGEEPTGVYPAWTLNNGSVNYYSGSLFSGTKNQVIRVGMQTTGTEVPTSGTLYLLAYLPGEIRKIAGIPFTAYPS